MPRPVVCAGEALIDLAPRADGTLEPLLGGGPFNAARALARLGQTTHFIGGVSRDRYGEALAGALAAEGVQLDAGLRSDLPTALAVAEFDRDGRATYRFDFEGTAAEALTPAAALAALPGTPAALHVGGLGLVLQPLAQAVEAVVGRLAGEALVMVDPNIRPAATPDLGAHLARVARVIGRADVVKVSEEDLQVLAPGVEPTKAGQALLGQGPKLVLLTLGAHGAVAFGRFGSRAVASPRVEVVDTIGAGDVFCGAWLALWLELAPSWTDGEAARDVTAFACRAAALSCTRAGASPPRRGEITA